MFFSKKINAPPKKKASLEDLSYATLSFGHEIHGGSYSGAMG